MEVFSASRRVGRPTFNITETEEAQPELPFSRAEEENATILASAFEIGDAANTYKSDGEIKLTKQKSRQEEALEAASKSAGELSQLISLTSMLQKQLHVGLSNCTRPPGLEPVGLALPPSQIIEMRREQFRVVKELLGKGRIELQAIAAKRQLSCVQLLKLRQYWPLSVYSPNASASSAIVMSGRDIIAVNCSYCALPGSVASTAPTASASAASKPRAGASASSSLAQALERARPCLVPLVFAQDGLPSLPADELSRPSLSVGCVFVHGPTGKHIASVSLWDCGVLGSSGPGGALETIHKHCQRRRHDSFSQLLFACIKNDATVLSNAPDGSCRWVVAPPLDTTLLQLGAASSQSLDPVTAAALLKTERLSDSIDLASINRATVVVLLSENVQAVISLQPVVGDGCKPVTGVAKGVARALLAVQARLALAVHDVAVKQPSSTASPAPESYLGLLVAGLRSAAKP